MEEEAACTFTCPDGRCVWQYDFMGSPTCECNEGLKYDKEQKICVGEEIECTFECPDKRCVWQYNFMGLPTCNCKEDAVYNKESKTCELCTSYFIDLKSHLSSVWSFVQIQGLAYKLVDR